MTGVDPQMLKGLMDLALLALINQREDYGYALIERLRESGLTDVAEGTVYPALARLERSGSLSTSLVASERGPARKYYAITEAGRGELAARQASWERLGSVMSHLMSTSTGSSPVNTSRRTP